MASLRTQESGKKRQGSSGHIAPGWWGQEAAIVSSDRVAPGRVESLARREIKIQRKRRTVPLRHYSHLSLINAEVSLSQ